MVFISLSLVLKSSMVNVDIAGGSQLDATLAITRLVGHSFGVPSHLVLRLFVVVANDSDNFDVCLFLLAVVWADSPWLGMCAIVGDCVCTLSSVSQQASVGRPEQELCDTRQVVNGELRGPLALCWGRDMSC